MAPPLPQVYDVAHSADSDRWVGQLRAGTAARARPPTGSASATHSRAQRVVPTPQGLPTGVDTPSVTAAPSLLAPPQSASKAAQAPTSSSSPTMAAGSARGSDDKAGAPAHSPPTAAPATHSRASPTAAVAATALRLLVVRSLHYGRFSNNVMSLVEATGLAAATGRSLATPRFDRCSENEGLGALFDEAALAAAVVAGGGSGGGAAHFAEAAVRGGGGGGALGGRGVSTEAPPPPAEGTAPPQLVLLQPPARGGAWASLVEACGPTGVYVPLRDEVAGRASHTWRGVAWAALAPSELPPFDAAAAGLPAAQQSAGTAGADLTASPAYALLAPGVASHGAPAMLEDSWLAYRLAAPRLARERCLLLGNPFLSVNWAALPRGALEAAARGVATPARRIDAAVDAWVASAGLPAGALAAGVGVHLRLRDIGNEAWACAHDPRALVATLHAAVAAAATAAAVAAAAAGAPAPPPVVAFLATDEPDSPCAALVRAALPRTLDLVSGDPALGGRGGCGEAAWVQAALARTGAFVGNHYSTFSGAVHTARVLRWGAPPNSTFWVR